MNKKQALEKIAAKISACPLCKKGGTGKVVPGEGSPDARVMFIGEAPGKTEAESGLPFVGRSGKFLRQAIRDIGVTEEEIFITSPAHYLPIKGKPSKETVLHGKEHLLKQIAIIDPAVIVLLGSTACSSLIEGKVEISKDHGRTVQAQGRTCLITFHPAYAMRFPDGKRLFFEDFQKLRELLNAPI